MIAADDILPEKTSNCRGWNDLMTRIIIGIGFYYSMDIVDTRKLVYIPTDFTNCIEFAMCDQITILRRQAESRFSAGEFWWCKLT